VWRAYRHPISMHRFNWVTGQRLSKQRDAQHSGGRFIVRLASFDVAEDTRANSDFLLTIPITRGVGGSTRAIPAHAWVTDPHGLVQKDDPKQFSTSRTNGPHTPGIHPKCVPFSCQGTRHLRHRSRDGGHRCRSGSHLRSHVSLHTIMHGANRFGLASLTNLDKLPRPAPSSLHRPLKIVNGSGSPLRVLALVPSEG